MHGVPLLDGEDGQALLDMEFLMKIMDVREQLEGKPAVEVINDARIENESRIRDVSGALAAAFGREDFNAARKLTAQLQYLNRVRVGK